MPDDRESEMALSDDGLYLFVRECVARLIGCVDWGHGGGRRFGWMGRRGSVRSLIRKRPSRSEPCG